MDVFGRFRGEVQGVLAAALPGVPLWPILPDNVNELPCVVVGRPGGRQTTQQVVFDLDLTVFIVGRRTSAGNSENELVNLADDVFEALGGTKGTKTSGGEVVAVNRVDPRMLTIAGQECPAYTIEVEASVTTC